MGIINQNPSVFKSGWLHVVIFRFFFINLRYILRISKKICIFSYISNFNQFFFKLNQFICNQCSIPLVCWNTIPKVLLKEVVIAPWRTKPPLVGF